MASFSIVGPIDIPTITRPGGKAIDRDRLDDFWADANCGGRVGCYVFGIRHGRGTLPYYAGRTMKSFATECFQPHKLTKYHDALTHIRRGTPVMYFVVLEATRGRPNRNAIRALEERLIGLGIRRNQQMGNVSGTREDDIIVRGVMGSVRGRPTVEAQAFRLMMGLVK